MRNMRRINIIDRGSAPTNEKAKRLVELHPFSGPDWGRKFAGISKKWMDRRSEILEAFQRLGTDNLYRIMISPYLKSSQVKLKQNPKNK